MSNHQLDTSPVCRSCGTGLRHIMVDLGTSPLCESYLSREQLNRAEPFFPLRVYVCHSCYLVQLEEFVAVDEIFSEYAYFSSYSDSWVQHAHGYVVSITKRLGLDTESHVVELASNDGYLLQHFLPLKIPVLGIEPAANVARAAKERGVPTRVEFFGEQSARQIADECGQADLVIGNNVLAQVPDIHDFVSGISILLKPTGTVTLEFPHLLRLLDENQFDTIYHEHFSYFSLIAVEKLFADHGITLFDVEKLSTHGGSLRIYGRPTADASRQIQPSISQLRDEELEFGLTKIATYESFQNRVQETKNTLLEFLIQAQREGHHVAGYGAPGKGNTLLNFCGIGVDYIDYTVDRNPYKQGKWLPGTRIPIFPPERIRETKPRYVLILPWNLKDEIIAQLSFIRQWGGAFVVPIPQLSIHNP